MKRLKLYLTRKAFGMTFHKLAVLTWHCNWSVKFRHPFPLFISPKVWEETPDDRVAVNHAQMMPVSQRHPGVSWHAPTTSHDVVNRLINPWLTPVTTPCVDQGSWYCIGLRCEVKLHDYRVRYSISCYIAAFEYKQAIVSNNKRICL